jgi:hypothetical protein
MTDDEKKTTPMIHLTDGFDGFEAGVEGTERDDQTAPGGVIQGGLIRFSNEATWEFRDGEEVSASLELIAVDIIRVVQKWLDGMPVETHVLGPGQKFLDVQTLNDNAPKEEWTTGPDGKSRGPYQAQYLVYLINPLTMDKYTYATGTTGGGICVRDLADKVKWMRRLRGEQVYAVITLADVFMNTRFGGRQRPHFIIKRWVQLGGGGKPAIAAPTPSPTPALEVVPPQPKPEPVPGMKTVTEPTLLEQTGDEIPSKGDAGTTGRKAPAPPPKPAIRHGVKGVTTVARAR